MRVRVRNTSKCDKRVTTGLCVSTIPACVRKAIAIAAVVAGGTLLDIVRWCFRSSACRVRVFAFVWLKVVSQHCCPVHCCA